LTGGLLVQLIIGGFGVSGILGAGVALFKLRPEVNQMAVTSTQAAAGEWQKLYDACKADLEAVEKERDAWRERALHAEGELDGIKRTQGRP
jgi:hypothetical protein